MSAPLQSPGAVRFCVVLLRRQLTLAVRRPIEIGNPLLFFAMVVALFPLGLGPAPDELAGFAPGILWIIALLSNLLTSDTVFRSDFEEDPIEQLLLAPQPPFPSVLAYIGAHRLLTGLQLALVSPGFALMPNLPDAAAGEAGGSRVPGTPGLRPGVPHRTPSGPATNAGPSGCRGGATGRSTRGGAVPALPCDGQEKRWMHNGAPLTARCAGPANTRSATRSASCSNGSLVAPIASLVCRCFLLLHSSHSPVSDAVGEPHAHLRCSIKPAWGELLSGFVLAARVCNGAVVFIS